MRAENTLQTRTAATLLMLAASACARAQQSGFQWQPEQASTLAPRVDALYNYLLLVSSLIGGSVCLLIVVFAFKYRRGSGASRANAPTEKPWLEAAWITIPILLSFFTFFWSARIFFDSFNAPAGAININVVGKQWFWELQHPEGMREMDELHIPVGRPVKLTLTSQDVIHSFFVPAFRIKQDALPDRVTMTWFTATKPGRYRFSCAQYCGIQHSNMGGWVYAMPPAEYERWLNHSQPQPSLAEAGAKLFLQYSCTGCHGPNASVRAPSLDGIYGKPVPLTDGSIVQASDRYVYDSIVLPGKQVVAGYQNIMPSYKGAMTQQQILQLVAYIRSLGSVDNHEKSTEIGDKTTRQVIREQQGRALEQQEEMAPKQPPSAAMPPGDKGLRPRMR